MTGVLIGVVVGVAGMLIVSWWERRPRRRREVEQCCRCNAEIAGRRIHTVVDHPVDDADIIDGPLLGGGTGVSADFCEGCCPGGCSNRRHAKLVA